ncbi:hypothetical protein ATN24_18945 [Clostridium butyricum]|nr:hypothetical protein ATN24_18945 [Clostridium butyricum]ALS18758.1 hypothetical protein ATD26_17895 [Clostridium butyricum]ANF15941.1 hypothetical protein AZ909_17925 [Clostridium butyricum]AOR95854.1 hypothetical protein BBB49_17390 [Clostridium butyricum]
MIYITKHNENKIFYFKQVYWIKDKIQYTCFNFKFIENMINRKEMLNMSKESDKKLIRGCKACVKSIEKRLH